MFWYRVTKYNPLNRNEKGHYIKDEWTSSWEIGKIHEGKKLELAEYMKVEDKYVAAINIFINYLKVDTLQIINLQKNDLVGHKDLIYTLEMFAIYRFMRLSRKIKKDQIENVARLSLRRNIWCMLSSEKMQVHFGDDYYMYIGTQDWCDKAIDKIHKSGLFVEHIACSPYCSDEEYERIMKNMKLGLEKTNYYSNGHPIFKKGNIYITFDVSCHSGGFWKMADSIKKLEDKATRLGTYDEFLNKIGD